MKKIDKIMDYVYTVMTITYALIFIGILIIIVFK
jgi:hypothetical protein